MKSIKSFCSHEIMIKNSRFIGILYPVNCIEDVHLYLNEVKKQYRDASHYCYAYIIDQEKKFSDDGEPGGTAGSPILQVLEKQDLSHVLAIVVRYFGGIKLGAGGLVRAYTKAITTTLHDCDIGDLVDGYSIFISFDYSLSKKIDELLGDMVIVKKEYLDLIHYEVLVTTEIYDELLLLNGIKIEVKKSIVILQ